MKHVISLLSAALLIASPMYGGAGYFDSFTIVESTFYDLGASTSNDNFDGYNLGEFNIDDTLSIGGQIKTYKYGGTDVYGADLYYSFHEVGSSPSFSGVGYSWEANLFAEGDQQWGSTSDATVTLSEVGNYELSIYVAVGTNGFEADNYIYDNNFGSNYTALLTVVPEPSSFALIGSLFALGSVVLRRKVRS